MRALRRSAAASAIAVVLLGPGGVGRAQPPALHLEGLPAAVRFGATLSQTQAALAGACVTTKVRRIDPPFLPRVKDRQLQIDCEGLVFAGRPRHVEFVIGDDALEMIWLMVTPAEETAVEADLARAYGPPQRHNARYSIFPGGDVAYRHDRAEVLYYAADLRADMADDFKPAWP